VLEWLSKVKYLDNHNFAKKARFPGTGKWLLKTGPFDDWLKAESSILWVNGKGSNSLTPNFYQPLLMIPVFVAGAGKTVLA
jgi:hypothetical protein